MEQLELFPNQDYDDALTWLIEGIRNLKFDIDSQTAMIKDYRDAVPYGSNFSRSYYFQEAFAVLDYWTR